MRTSLFQRLQAPDARLSILLLAVGTLTSILISPKWTVPLAAWVPPIAFLLYYRNAAIPRKWLWLMLANTLAGTLDMYGVMPFPTFLLVLVVLLDSVKMLALFALERYLTKGRTHVLYTLVFPALQVSREYLESLEGLGAWVSLANTQYAFPWLTQLASVTGVWGISFLMYWLASLIVWSINREGTQRSTRPVLAGYSALLLTILIWGAIRYERVNEASPVTVRLGGVTVPNLPFIEALYQDRSGQPIHLDPKSNQNDPDFRRAYGALGSFVEHPARNRFPLGYAALGQLHDQLFVQSQKAVDRGAQLVMWSEGNGMVIKTDEPALIQRGRQFAARNRVYFLMAIAAVLPGKLTPQRLFLENKTILIDPTGRVLNTFYKNHPVPLAEPSKPGDGTIPTIQTPYGRIAPSICYDADFIQTMRQLGRQEIGLMLLPSGDWYEISPYHSYMAVFRGIENGTSVARQVSGGLSLFTDYRGRELARHDYFDGSEHLTLVAMPVQSVPTLYTRFGDWLVYASMLGLLGVTVGLLTQRLTRRKTEEPAEVLA